MNFFPSFSTNAWWISQIWRSTAYLFQTIVSIYITKCKTNRIRNKDNNFLKFYRMLEECSIMTSWFFRRYPINFRNILRLLLCFVQVKDIINRKQTSAPVAFAFHFFFRFDFTNWYLRTWMTRIVIRKRKIIDVILTNP